MKKRVLVAILSTIFVLSLSLGVEASMSFTDVPTDHACYIQIAWCSENGIMNGTSSTTFSPDAPMTRGMAITIIGRFYEWEGETISLYYVQMGTAFNDVSSSAYYAKYVGWGAAEGIVGGYGNGNYGPNDIVTRQDFAVMLVRASSVLGIDFWTGGITPLDASSVSGYALSSVESVLRNNLISWDSNHIFHPLDATTRAVGARAICNLLGIS